MRQQTELQQTIQELHSLDQQLWRLENKYSVLSADFYEAMMAGDLSEFDGEPGYHEDFLSWLAWYESRRSHEHHYRELIQRRDLIQQFRGVVVVH